MGKEIISSQNEFNHKANTPIPSHQECQPKGRVLEETLVKLSFTSLCDMRGLGSGSPMAVLLPFAHCVSAGC